MNTQLIDRFHAACGADSVLPLRISCRSWTEPVIRKFHQPFVVLGRDVRCDLCLNAAEVSPAHAYLQVLGGSVFGVDLHSQTGTHWPAGTEQNGWLSAGSPIQVGPFHIELAADLLEEADAFGPPREWNPILSRSTQTGRIPVVTLELLNTADRQPPRRLNRLLALVGSAPGCNVRLVSSTVSPVHCSLLRTPIGLWVIDLLGRDGIKVNGTAMRYALVQNGDELSVGKFRLRVGSEAVRPLAATVEMPAQAARLTAPAGAENGSSFGTNGSHTQTAEPPPRLAQPTNGSPDLSAHSLADLMLVKREEPLLLPLVQQFHAMQQQMFDQFQQAMMMIVQMFTQMHREQTDQVRAELDRVHVLTEQLQALQAELRNQQSAHGTRAATAKAAGTPRPASTSPPARAENDAPDDRIHGWITERMAALQQERQSQWQKILKFLGGK